ncbi:MAG TPA: MogA/MoaB family molybdenum cofactor biosynthesis protein [Synechococcales cyanobacterium M55_K2018_004]|nr:MogA/MoaB family molybdenum cofactor biosynthesis protein [Synechococcales cyanobacterium M55_K2018_004]
MTASLPHPDLHPVSVSCAIVTVSDTRTMESDRSGHVIRQLLHENGHIVAFYTILPDEPDQIAAQLLDLCQQPEIEALVLNGGTGIAPRDTTYDAIERLLEKTLPGFGELFRWLSYQEIGSRAIASRAVAGVCQGRIVFSLPGSSHAVRLAMEKLILPELGHLVQQLRHD